MAGVSKHAVPSLRSNPLRVLVCEFVTGGGMRGEALPASLAREGAMMRDALVNDLMDLPIGDLEVIVTHDDRLPDPRYHVDETIREGDDVWALWSSMARDCEVVWPIAPETGGLLSRLTAMFGEVENFLIGPDRETIEIASSKFRTAERLRTAGVPTPSVWRAGERPEGEPGPFVLKPDDGAGCEDTRLVEQAPDDVPAGHVLQSYVPGEAASLTILRDAGRTRLLTVNCQHVAIEDGAFRFLGLTVAAFDDPDGRFAALASAVGDALPGLDGLFGIDLALTPEGPVVIEVNPRLTTAYCGLREAIGFNPLVLVSPFATRDHVPEPRIRPVEIAL